jgi:hypothetical protein
MPLTKLLNDRVNKLNLGISVRDRKVTQANMGIYLEPLGYHFLRKSLTS